MQTDMAANSDSTLTYSQGARSPVFTSADSASTMCVCGEMGYAPITSGRHRATASATAREPSICLRMSRLSERRADVLVGVGGSGGVAVTDGAREALAERRGDGVERDQAVAGGERTDQRRSRQRAAQVPARDLARRDRQHMRVELAQPEPAGGA